MKLRSIALLGIAVLAVVLMTQMTPVQSASPPARIAAYPVSYNFLQNALANGQRASAPGANRWACKPTKLHPRPVVLVHGTAGNAATNWGTYSALLANRGYCVFALTYGVVAETRQPVPLGGMDDIRTSAKQLAAFVAKVGAATGARKVDLVGHSQGTLMPNYYVRFLGGHKHVLRYISIAPLWHGEGGDSAAQFFMAATALGLPASDLPVCRACRQMSAGSPFMQQMRTGRLAHKDVSYTNIVTRYDEVVIPYSSGIQTGYSNMRNVIVQDRCSNDFSEHLQIASSANVAQIVLNALRPAAAKKVVCKLTLPLNG